MLARRLEDKIRELCATLPSDVKDDFPAKFSELRSAIAEHARRRQNWLTSAVLLGPEVPRERRHSTPIPDDPLFLLIVRDPYRGGA